MQICRAFIILVLSAIPLNVMASEVGIVSYLSGTMIAIDSEGAQRLLAEKSVFSKGDVLTTLSSSHARIRFNDGTQLVLRPNTSLNIENVYFDEVTPQEDNFAIGLIKGGVRAVTGLIAKRNRDRVKFMSLTATVGIRGTHFGLQLCNQDCIDYKTISGGTLKDGLYADVADGIISIANEVGEQEFQSGMLAYVADSNTAPNITDESNGHRVTVPLSAMFDSNAQLWSEGVKCNACSVR